jgi:Contractile injection system tube protein
MALVKAKLISSDGGGTIEFMFNPNQLAFQRQISLNKNVGARTGRGLPKVNFAYPEPSRLTINDILLDTYEEDNAKSVMPHIAQFEKAVRFLESGSNKNKRPPTYIFTWGSHQYIRCFVSNLSYKLTMFLTDGTPVRAKLDLVLEEIDLSSSNPNLGAPNNVNRTGDTPQSRMS